MYVQIGEKCCVNELLYLDSLGLANHYGACVCVCVQTSSPVQQLLTHAVIVLYPGRE